MCPGTGASMTIAMNASYLPNEAAGVKLLDELKVGDVNTVFQEASRYCIIEGSSECGRYGVRCQD